MVSASPDHLVSAISTPAYAPTPEILNEMADVAGAMFSLQLLRTVGSPAHDSMQLSAVAEPVGLPAVHPAPLEPSPPTALPVTVPTLDITPTPDPVSASIALPASLPLPDFVPEVVLPEAPAHQIPVTVQTPQLNTALLSEIGFLDD